MAKQLNFMMSHPVVDQDHLVDKKVVHIHDIVPQKGKDVAVQLHQDESHLPPDTDQDPLVKSDQGQRTELDLPGKGIQDLGLQKEILIESRKNLNENHPVHGQDLQGIRRINPGSQVHIQVLIITTILKENLRNTKEIHQIRQPVTVLIVINQSDLFYIVYFLLARKNSW